MHLVLRCDSRDKVLDSSLRSDQLVWRKFKDLNVTFPGQEQDSMKNNGPVGGGCPYNIIVRLFRSSRPNSSAELHAFKLRSSGGSRGEILALFCSSFYVGARTTTLVRRYHITRLVSTDTTASFHKVFVLSKSRLASMHLSNIPIDHVSATRPSAVSADRPLDTESSSFFSETIAPQEKNNAETFNR